MLRPDAALVLGGELAPEALAVAERVAGERDARIVPADGTSGETRLAASGAFQRRNFALARTAAETYLRALGIAPTRAGGASGGGGDDRARAPAGRRGGSARRSSTARTTPHASRALIEALPEMVPADRARWRSCSACSRTRTPRACSRALLGACERAWFTAPPSSRALSPAALESLARQLGFDAAVCEPEPARALAEAQRWARERGAGAAVLATGSVYLVGELLRTEGPRTASSRTEPPRRRSTRAACRR